MWDEVIRPRRDSVTIRKNELAGPTKYTAYFRYRSAKCILNLYTISFIIINENES